MPEFSLRNYPILPVLQGFPLSEPKLRLLSIMLSGVSLASVLDLSSLVGSNEKLINSGVKHINSVVEELIGNGEDGYLVRRKLGSESGLTGRIWVSDRISKELEIPMPTNLRDWSLARHLERLPVVEHTYPALAKVEGLGQFRSIVWHQQLSFYAKVNFENGWILVFYSGLLESYADLRNMAGAIADDLRENAEDRIQPWPSFFLWVVRSRWQAEMVRRTLGELIGPLLAFYIASDSTYVPPQDMHTATGGIWQSIEDRDMGNWPWEQRLQSSPWAEPDGIVLSRVLDSVIRFPGAWFSLIKADTGVNDKKRVQEALSRLILLDWIEKRKLKGKPRYSVKGRGFHHAARRDGVPNVNSSRRAQVPAFDGRPNFQLHEDGFMSFLEQVMIAGFEVEPGWRVGDDLGQGRGGIVPDALVYLDDGPYGQGWYWVEYERSARGKKRAGRKLTGYLSKRRRDEYPVLFVLWNETAEKNFQSTGQAKGLRMATTTIGRLKKHGAVGKPGCWSLYGQDVIIGHPVAEVP